MANRAKFREAIFVQTLINADGPQLLLLKTKTTSLVLGLAIRQDTWTDPYFAVEISRDQFADFMSDKFDLRYLFLKPAFKGWYIFDLADIQPDDAVALQRVNLTGKAFTSKLPGPGIFSRELTEDLVGAFAPTQDHQKFQIDGSWDLPEISRFYDQYTDLYVLYNSVDVFLDDQASIDDRRKVQDAFIKPWQGGGSYTSFFDSLLNVQDREDRLRVGAIAYNSPGYVDVRGKAEQFAEVRALVDHFAKDREKITAAYNSLHKWLSEYRLLTLSSDKFDVKGDLAEEVGERTARYAAILKAVPYEKVLRMSHKDPLIAAKVLLAVYRRLSKMHEYFLQGRVTFGTGANVAPVGTKT